MFYGFKCPVSFHERQGNRKEMYVEKFVPHKQSRICRMQSVQKQQLEFKDEKKSSL